MFGLQSLRRLQPARLAWLLPCSPLPSPAFHAGTLPHPLHRTHLTCAFSQLSLCSSRTAGLLWESIWKIHPEIFNFSHPLARGSTICLCPVPCSAAVHVKRWWHVPAQQQYALGGCGWRNDQQSELPLAVQKRHLWFKAAFLSWSRKSPLAVAGRQRPLKVTCFY